MSVQQWFCFKSMTLNIQLSLLTFQCVPHNLANVSDEHGKVFHKEISILSDDNSAIGAPACWVTVAGHW
jgi:hypothetical protein